MPAKFVLRRTKDDGFRFNLLATNGQIVASSETYKTKRAALAGIESVRRNGPTATFVDETDPAVLDASVTAKATARKASSARRSTARKAAAADPGSTASTKAGAAPAKKAAAKKAPAKKAPAAGSATTSATPRRVRKSTSS